MKLKDLIDNLFFLFNIRYRVIEYLGNYGTDGAPNDDTKLIYDSEGPEGDFSEVIREYGDYEIIAINSGEDGVTEIEIMQFC